MRVIAGKAKRINLVTPEGLDTRPTTDRIKETLFNMINQDLYDCNFLDLFSGSGGIGIEALSRGAKLCYFVENNNNAIKCIKENLSKTHFEQQGHILTQDVFNALTKLNSNNEVFDIIFMDPPYNKDLEKEVLNVLASSNLIDENTLIIVEASLETDFSYLNSMGLEILKTKKYKTNLHAFIVKQ